MISSEPFKHAVIDNFADAEVLDSIVAAWPQRGWKTHDHPHCKNKRSLAKLDQMPEVAQRFILELNQRPVLSKFSAMLGYELIPDPHIVTEGSLWGGGLHEISRDGFLHTHIDFNVHPSGVYRRANLLIYLNRDWTWGGDLQLWDEQKQEASYIAPVFNRAVLFETSEKSWHGHPIPLGCPKNLTRKSIAIYYYSAKGEDVKPHSTIYLET